jgi:hypothetical protein
MSNFGSPFGGGERKLESGWEEWILLAEGDCENL